MADARVICSIERLYDWEPANQAVIGVTLSAAWGNASTAPPSNFLLPWKWLPWQKGPEQLGFYWACGITGDTNTDPKFSQSPISPWSLTRAGKSVASIRNNGNYSDFANNGIQPRYDQVRKVPSQLGYPNKGQNAITVAASASDGPGDISNYGSGAFWPSILADLSTRPAPIPHALLLSFIFQLGNIADLLPKKTDGTIPKPEDCFLLVAPVLTSDATGKGYGINPVNDPAAKPLKPGDDNSSMLWAYTDNNFIASAQMVDLGPAPKRKSFFDLATRLVKAPNDEAWHFNEDWQSSFESRMGERLDLSAELVRILGNETFDDKTTRNLIDAAIAALRDVVGIGIDAGPSGVSFLQPGNVNPPTAIATIKAALPNSDLKDVKAWKAFLQTKVFGKAESVLFDPYLANLELWCPEPIKAADAILQFNRVRQKLLAPESLWALLEAQVSILAPGATVTPPASLNTLPATLRAENLGRYWRKKLLDALKIPSTGYTADAIRKALAEQMQTLAIARFKDTDFLPAVGDAIAADTVAALKTNTSITDWAAAAEYAIPKAASTSSTDPAAGLAPQGITIQINELGDTSNAAVDGNEVADVRKLQGAGLLLGYDTIDKNGKVASTSGYNCLNYADVCYLGQSDGKKQGVVLEHAAIAPLRFTWHNNLAITTVSYNNEPLPAPGPLSRAAKLVSPGGQDSMVAVGTDLLWYSYPTPEKSDAKEDPRVGLTALTFGRDYHPQPFLVSNAGAVPKVVATGYLDLKTGKDLDQAPNIGETWKSINYRRQTVPGALRLANPNPDPTQKHLKLPPIPDGVFRRVEAQDDQPMVMLVPDQSRFSKDLPITFAVDVRPPATDLLTWDRFVNGFGNTLADKRAAVVNGFLAEIGRHSDKKADITIDDPATVYKNYDCRLYYELYDDSSGTPAKGDFINFPLPAGAEISAVQARALHFSFEAAKDETTPKKKPPSIQVNASSIKVTVYEGRYATLKLYACVHKDYLSRFDSGVLSSAKLNGDYYLLNPTNIVVEVATDALPSATDLFAKSAFDVGRFNLLDGTATISLNLGGVTNEEYVYSAEVLRQVWRWQGRPVIPLPATGEVTNEWLIREFGTRADTDLLRAPMLPPPVGRSTYVFTEHRGSLLSDDDRARGNLQKVSSPVSVPAEARLLGTYIRYGVQAESRYKPLILQNSYVRGKDGDGNVWRNLYIPSRKLSQIKPPNVKLILPLTRNPDDQYSGPGILVMLRGPWFQECGLGERLEAQVLLREAPGDDPNDTKTPKTFYYQYGPDPILSNPDATKVDPVHPGQETSGWKDQRTTIAGPIGHTFDTVSNDQLFVNTSFVLNYPVIGNHVWTSWAFCQLQVRRVVDVIGGNTPADCRFAEEKDGGKGAQKANQKIARVGCSDWSPPAWIQLLPDFDRYSTDSQFANLDLSYQPATGKFTLVNHDTAQPVKLAAGNGDSIYANYLAVTHFVPDFTGVPVQEVYDGLCRQSGTDWIAMNNSTTPSADLKSYFRARVLTVQGNNPTVTLEDDFWDNMFTIEKTPGDPEGILVGDRDRLRIVAVSRPIDVPDAQYKRC